MLGQSNLMTWFKTISPLVAIGQKRIKQVIYHKLEEICRKPITFYRATGYV